MKLKHDWEQSIVLTEKETYEQANPASVYTDTNLPMMTNQQKSFFEGYINPFVPIYCKGDDLSHAIVKPTILYDEVAGSKIEIPDMPAYKTQDDLGECRAFSLATLLQWRTCKVWKSDIADCKNLPPDSAISYFGLMIYTNQISGQSKTFQPNQQQTESIHNIIERLSRNGNRLILESCKPFENLIDNLNAEVGNKKRDDFFNLLKSIYNSKKQVAESNVDDCNECISQINRSSGLNVKLINLKKALTKSSYEQFLYSLFFDDCTLENFPSGFSSQPYPLDEMDVSAMDIKNQIEKGLTLGKPILYTGLCISEDPNSECKETHSLVISGFKKVYVLNNSGKTKEVIKVHNSWGAQWQKIYNNGWIDVDVFIQNTAKVKKANGQDRFGSATVVWLEA